MAGIKQPLDLSKYGKRDSLVRQASVDRLQNAAIKQQNVEKYRKEIVDSSEYARILKKLNDEGVELIRTSEVDVPMRFALILSAEEDSAQFLSSTLIDYEKNGVRLKHLEIRPEKERNGSYGYGDEAYIKRREELNEIAKAYKYGDDLPEIEYSPEEHKVWEIVFKKLQSLHSSHTCIEYQQNFRQMELEGLLEPSRIPKLSHVNKYLQRKTGFTLRPCSGLLSARDFLASLAFRVFQTTIYIRHHGSPHHSPEPDLVHEFIGHCPMFADPFIAQMSQQIGLLSLGATDEQIEQLATMYWFMIEFGLCRQDDQLKAIGAGLLSSYGELMHACSDKPIHEEFDPQRAAVQKYEDSDYQPLYFVADSIFDAVTKLRHKF
uniref:Biopterin-dependent aromatic amino acid hydroxylase family profile domain-containing protein n=1 Tax=Setaria digitata TaxID=48799 RepID=A0A915Q428_9BILA